jgi:hypothetical protein
MARRRDIADLTALAQPGARIAVRVTPRASRNALIVDDGLIRVLVTAAPAEGEANDAVRLLLAEALGVPPSRLALAQGARSRDKVILVS